MGVMNKIPRYDLSIITFNEGDGYQWSEIEENESDYGNWVRYDDIKHLIKKEE